MIKEFKHMTGFELAKAFLNLNNYIRGDKNVSKSICSTYGSATLLQSATDDEQSTHHAATGTYSKSY